MNKNKRFRIKVQCLHEMTGSCFLFTVYYPNSKIEKFVFDCGRFEGTDNKLNEFFPFDPKECSFLVHTHAHDDHISRVPLFVKHGFNGKIYSTPTTYKFANFILYNNSYMYTRKQEEHYSEPLYDDSDVEKTMKKFIQCPYRKIVKPTKNISFILYENGHIPGSCLIYLIVSYPGEKDIRILFTGDYHYKNMFYPVPPLPEAVTKNYISLFITESTYGTTNSCNCDREENFMKELSYYLSCGKTVIIPSFALGRVSSCIYLINNYQKNKILPKVPMWLDGYNAKHFHNMFLYDDIGLCINRSDLKPYNLKYVNSISVRNSILEDNNPKIVIAPGGCSDQGSITHYMKNGIPRDDVTIFYSGYTSPSSTGGKLKTAKKGDYISYLGENLEIRCDVAYTSALSAHAKKDEFFEHLFYPCSYTNSYLVTHGDPQVSRSFANDISNEFANVTADVINSSTCYTIDASGIIQVDNISIY